MKGFTKTQLQLIAVIAMVCDHLAWLGLPLLSVSARLLHIIGCLSLPIMCFFIAEGFLHTGNLHKYIGRILLCWAAAALPFYYLFHDRYGYKQNILFDLLLGLLLLTVLEQKTLGKWQKGLFSFFIFVFSCLLSSLPILPLLYILIFYYKKKFMEKAIWFSCTTTGFILLLHFFSADHVSHDRLYLFGLLLALPLLRLYNGTHGTCPVGKYFFYAFYPIHFILLYVLQYAVFHEKYYELYLGIQLFVIAATLVTVTKIILARPSRAQASSAVFSVCSLIYLFGLLLEITTNSLPAVYAAIKVQYLGELLLFIGFTWFMTEFCHHPLPRLVYITEGVISIVFMLLVFTANSNHFFYREMYMDFFGPFPRIVLEYGPGFFLFIAYIIVICLGSLFLCIREYRQSTGIEKRRIAYMIGSIICPWIPPVIRAMDITQGYEISSIGVLGSTICVALALIKYGYFDSVQLASKNALDHGKEGILVISPNRRILYFNQIIQNLFPDIHLREDAYTLPHFQDIMEHGMKNLSVQNKVYEMRVEPLVEAGYVQGYMLWAIDMTEHYIRLIAAENSAHTDSLTGLNNRSYFHACLDEHVRLGGTGSMIMLDLDDFKHVNDTYGHGIGDTALLSLSESMKRVADGSHLTCRMGGDEFCLFFKDITDKEKLASLSKDLIYSFSHALSKAGIANVTSISLGIAILDNSAIEEVKGGAEVFDELYRRADRALYVAKNNGKNVYRFYSSI